MKNMFKLLGIIALVAVMVSVTSCATASSIGGTADTHGLFSSARVAADGGTRVASYSVILGLFDSGYPDYANKVKVAEAAGKQITTVTIWYFGFFTQVTAYAH
jgi:hypothetical protein